MHNSVAGKRSHVAAFTLTELLVLVGVGAILSSVLAADFSQVRLKLLQQSCAANLKEWGVAFGLYAQDYNGTLFMQLGTFAWDDVNGTYGNSPLATNVYFRYLGNSGYYVTTVRTLRVCPYVSATVSNYNPAATQLHTYSLVDPLATGLAGLTTYQSISEANSGIANFEWITLKTVPYPSQFLLLMDGGSQYVHAKGASGNSSGANGLAADANGIPAGDTTRAIDRHGGGVNCLFADQHVSWITYSNLVQQDTVPCSGRVPNPWFAEN